jgi:hypothetical protein
MLIKKRKAKIRNIRFILSISGFPQAGGAGD